MSRSTLGRNEIRRKLIMLVKAHPILWVHTIGKIHEKYRPEKNKIWNMISAEMGIPYKKLRQMWEGLRYQYKRDLKLFGSKSNWQFFFEMDFLRETKFCKEDVVHYSDSENADDEEIYKELSLTSPTTSCSSNLLPTNAAGTAFGVENQPLETTTTSNCEINLSSSTEDLEFLSNIDENVVKQEPEFDLEPHANATRGEQQDHVHKTDNVHCSIEFQEPRVSTSCHKSSSMPVQEISNTPAATISNFQKKPDTDFNIKDDDYFFVMSILPSLKQIPTDRKFPTRIGILSLIEEALSELCDQQ